MHTFRTSLKASWGKPRLTKWDGERSGLGNPPVVYARHIKPPGGVYQAYYAPSGVWQAYYAPREVFELAQSTTRERCGQLQCSFDVTNIIYA